MRFKYPVRSRMRPVLAALIGISLGACKDLTQDIPDGMLDPGVARTREGAISLYKGAKIEFLFSLMEYVSESAMFTDEAVDNTFRSTSQYAGRIPLNPDARNPSEDRGAPYGSLHQARNQLTQAVKLLALFEDEIPVHYQGELYALQGFILTYLAELFCSGVPLTTVDFDGDFTLSPGIRRDSLLKIALTLFDSALTYSGDVTTISQLAHAGAARAWLQLDNVTQAAVHASQVSPGFSYTLSFLSGNRVGSLQTFSFRLSDREGGNGLPFRSSGDPRIAVTRDRVLTGNDTLYFVTKYTGANAKILVASGIEALLIVAEDALLHDDESWLSQLNALRTNGGFTVSTAGDTTWHAGVGGATNLRPLTDPANEPLPPGKTEFDARLDLLIRERAFWLYMTGHRQGDLRRLVRRYGRDPEQTYPTGFYGRDGVQFGVRYGAEVVYPVPLKEHELNVRYQGCFDMEA